MRVALLRIFSAGAAGHSLAASRRAGADPAGADPAGAPCATIYANHSRRPNTVLQHWPRRRGVLHSRDSMWLVAKESIEAGRELRFDYEAGGTNYW